MSANERRGIWDFVTRERKRDHSKSDEVLGIARSFLDWAEQPYHQRFEDYLRRQSEEPVDMTDQFKMLAGTARANTFKEILKHVRQEAQRAEMVLGDPDG